MNLSGCQISRNEEQEAGTWNTGPNTVPKPKGCLDCRKLALLHGMSFVQESDLAFLHN